MSGSGSSPRQVIGAVLHGTLRIVRAAAIALGALLLAVVAHRAFIGFTVTVDGERVAVRRGAEVGQVLGTCDSSARQGHMLSASADHHALVGAGGLPATVLLNGEVASRGEPLSSGDAIRTIPGPDVVEPVREETRTLEPAAQRIGAGTVEKIVSSGRPGLAVVRVGSVSGEVVATETVVPAVPAVARMVPAPGANLVALTFDDGPWPGQTEQVLRILRERNVPATFFMLGSQVARAPDLARSVANDGHAIGNHTYWHVFLSSARPDVAAWEIGATNVLIQQTTGVRPVWLRAPGGKLAGPAQAYIASQGMASALWTVDPQDWRADSTPEQLAWSVIGAAHPGAIVLLHDGGGDQTTTIAALPTIIDGLRAAGYEFVTLDEMPGVRASW